MMKIQQGLLSLGIVMMSTCVHAQVSMNYATSVKVNGIELNQPVAANQVQQIFGKSTQKINKEYSECTANHDYTTSFKNGKFLRFEVFAEDNPQIKSDNYFNNKNNFEQLNNTQGRIWLSWKNTQAISEQILINNKPITAQYTYVQFKKDFPVSAQTGQDIVLMLDPTEAKQYLKQPHSFDAGYTSALYFHFKNGKLSSFEINQGIAC